MHTRPSRPAKKTNPGGAGRGSRLFVFEGSIVGIKGKKQLDVSAVVDMRTSSESFEVLAARYGVSTSTVYQIRKGCTWQHVKPTHATVKTKAEILTCIHCRKAFPRPNAKGRAREVCDVCRGRGGRYSELGRIRALRIRMKAVKAGLRPIVEELVREALAKLRLSD